MRLTSLTLVSLICLLFLLQLPCLSGSKVKSSDKAKEVLDKLFHQEGEDDEADSEKFDHAAHHQQDESEYQTIQPPSKGPSMDKWRNNVLEEKLKEILKDDPEIPKTGKAGEMIKKFAAQFTKVMAEKAKKSEDSEERETDTVVNCRSYTFDSVSLTAFAFAKTLHQMKEEFPQHPEIFESYQEILSRPLEPEKFTKADSWAMVNFLLQFSESGVIQIGSAEGTEITKRFSYLLSAKLEEVRAEHLHTAYRRAPRKSTGMGNGIGAVCQLLKEMYDLKKLKSDYLSSAYLESALKLAKSWEQVPLEEVKDGDVVIFPPTPNNRRGHAQIKTAHGWLSDHKQRDSLYPDDEFKEVEPTVYRHF